MEDFANFKRGQAIAVFDNGVRRPDFYVFDHGCEGELTLFCLDDQGPSSVEIADGHLAGVTIKGTTYVDDEGKTQSTFDIDEFIRDYMGDDGEL